MLFLLSELGTIDSDLLERCAAHPDAKGRTRRYIARSSAELYPDRPDLRKHHEPLRDGWLVATNLNNGLKKKVMLLAVQIAGLTYGENGDVMWGSDES